MTINHVDSLLDVIVKEDKRYIRKFINKQSKIYEQAGFGKIKLNYKGENCKTEFLAHSFIKEKQLFIIVYSLDKFNESEFKDIIIDMEVINVSNKDIAEELTKIYDKTYIVKYLETLKENTLCMLKEADQVLRDRSVVPLNNLIQKIEG